MKLEGARLLSGEERETHVYAWEQPEPRVDHEEDGVRIDALIARFFSSFTHQQGVVPTVAALPFYFVPRGLITKADASGVETYDVRAFVEPRASLLSSGRLKEFSEHEVEAHTEIFGQIAQRWSLYRKTGTLEGKRFEGEGRKTFQLIKTREGWRIAALAWEDVSA